jgi:hypothetical protein
MKRFYLFLLLLSLAPPAASAANPCPGGVDAAVSALRSRSSDPSYRSAAGTCVVRNFLSVPEVSAAALKVIQDPNDDLFLREDLIEAFGDARLRQEVKVEQALAPELNAQDKLALDHTVGGAGKLLALAQAVKSMDDSQIVSPRETDFIKAISGIAKDSKSHVVLRTLAVETLEKVMKQMVDSGLYDERALRVAQESLSSVAYAGDNASYFSGAAEAYGRLAESGLPYFSDVRGGRSIASTKSK